MPQTHRGWKSQAVCEKRLRTKEENIRLLFVIAIIASMLFAADAAYALGGGGFTAMVRDRFCAGNLHLLCTFRVAY
jgi:hypothetical protein